MLIGKIEALKLEIKGKNWSERFYWKLLRDINELSFFFLLSVSPVLFTDKEETVKANREKLLAIFSFAIVSSYCIVGNAAITCYWMSNFKHNWNLKIKSFFFC